MFSRTQIKQVAKSCFFKIPFLKKMYLNKLLVSKEYFEKDDDLNAIIEEADEVILEKKYTKKVGLVKDGLFHGLISKRAYYLKYVRFLKNNNIEYEYYNILRHDWQEKAKQYDVIIWHTHSDPSSQEIALNKIYVLEKLMGKKCLPSFDEIWSYENKINAHYLFNHYSLPEIPTFVSHDKYDTIKYLNQTQFPIISKLDTGSASEGVEKIDTLSSSLKLLNKVFSFSGRKTYFFYKNQKNYVLFQEFMNDANFDLRIMVVGDKLFGYYRYPNKGDYKASGAGNYEKKEIDPIALDLAFKVKEKYGARFLATDLLYSKKYGQYFIIESSIFIGIDTCEQLVVNGIPGYYKRISEGIYNFHEGKYWIQELTLKELFTE